MAKLLNRQDLLDQTQIVSEQLEKLKEQVQKTQAEILLKIESEYPQMKIDPGAQFIDRAQKMIFLLREQLSQKRLFGAGIRIRLQEHLKDLKQATQMTGWQPQYIDLNPSQERLAETVMKLEREIFDKKRPRTLGGRYVFMRIGNPVDLGIYAESYVKNPSHISRLIAEELRDNIQLLIEGVGIL